MSVFNRREFLLASAVGITGLSRGLTTMATENSGKSRVALVKTGNRREGVVKAVNLLNLPDMKGRNVFIKPNFNTADPTPGSTHNDVLATLVNMTKEREAGSVTVGDRCGPGDTQKVMEDKGIFDMARDMKFNIVNFDTLEEKEWQLITPPNSYWGDGFYMARPLLESDYVITTGCLKTHGFGGHFTLSMKLSVGAVHRKHMFPQLHQSPYMREMIAEINLGYTPQLVVMDGVEVFTDGGPMEGTLKKADVILAGTDRVAMDAVGLAVLKEQGANSTIMDRKIFEQDQMKHAVAIGLGISGPGQIDIVTGDAGSEAYGRKLESILCLTAR